MTRAVYYSGPIHFRDKTTGSILFQWSAAQPAARAVPEPTARAMADPAVHAAGSMPSPSLELAIQQGVACAARAE